LDPNEPSPIEEPVKEEPKPPRRRIFKLNAKWIVFFIWLALMCWGFYKIRPLILLFLEPDAGSVVESPKAGKKTIKTSVPAKDKEKALKGSLKHAPLKAPSRPVTNLPNEVNYFYANHTLQVTISTDRPQNVVITVLNAQARMVASVFDGPWAVGQHTVSWFGKNLAGDKVPPGNYTLVIQANGQTTSGMITIPPN